MPTFDRIFGFEYGLATPSANGLGLCDAVVGSPTIQNTYKRSGSYALRCNPGAAAATNIQIKCTAGQTYYILVLYVMFHAWPSSRACIITLGNAVGSPYGEIFLDTADHKLEFVISTSSQKYGTALSLDTWYRVEAKYYVGGTTHTLDGQVDGNAITQVTSSGRTATTVYSIRLGFTAAVTGDVIFDDGGCSLVSTDYPIGAAGVDGSRPSGDGTHNNAANIMEDSAGNDIDGVTYVASSYLDEDPWLDAANDYVRQTGNGASNYCEILFADTVETQILGVMAILQYSSASTSLNSGACIIIDEDATEITLWGNPTTRADYSETSRFYKCVMLPTPAGGWDAAAVNAIKCRFGYSDDANPDPYWQGIMLEIIYAPVSGTQETASMAIKKGMTAGEQASVQGAASAGIKKGMTAGEQANVQGTVSAEIQKGISVAGGMVVEEGASAGIGKGITAEGRLTIYEVISLGRSLGVGEGGQLNGYENIALDKSLTIPLGENANVQGVISLGRGSSVGGGELLNGQEAITLAWAGGLGASEEVGTAAIEEAVSLGMARGMTSGELANLQDSLALGRTLSIQASEEIEGGAIEETVSLGMRRGIMAAELAELQDSLGLGKRLELAGADLAELQDSLALGKQLELAGTGQSQGGKAGAAEKGMNRGRNKGFIEWLS